MMVPSSAQLPLMTAVRTGTSISPPRPGHHHVDIPAAALGANQPSVPFRHWRLGTVPACLLCRVRFTPVTTCFAPDHKPDVSRGSVAERHRRATVGFHLPLVAA
jgi:hypothetical protein